MKFPSINASASEIDPDEVGKLGYFQDYFWLLTQMSSLQYFRDFLPSFIITIRQVRRINIISRVSEILLINALYTRLELHLLALVCQCVAMEFLTLSQFQNIYHPIHLVS